MRWALALLLVALGVWAFVVEPRRQTVATAAHALPGAPSVRIVALSDLHVGSIHVDAERVERVVDEALALEPDVVLLLGDLVATKSLGASEPNPRAWVPSLGRLDAPLGVYSVPGNHDHWYDALEVNDELRRAGITVLENGAVPLETDPPLWLVGVDDDFTEHARVVAAFEDVPPEVPVLVATHSPDVFPRLPDRPSLTLAGHTHGGQVALPFIGAVFVPSRFGTRYARGAFEEGSRRMHVTSGIGTSVLPVRFLVPPEILVVELGPS